VQTFERTEAARRAGVASSYLDKVIELGLVQADADGRITIGGIRRVMIVRALEETGVSPDALASFARERHLSLEFVDASGYEVFAGLADKTFSEIAAERGVPLKLLASIREVMGGITPQPDELMREDELLVLPWIEMLQRLGLSETSIDHTLRVYGDSGRRAAETESEWWRRELEGRFAAEGRPLREVLDFARDVAGPLGEVADAALVAIYHARQRLAWSANVIDGITRELAAAGLYARQDRPPAMCFLDVSGFTRLTRERGDTAAVQLAEKLRRLVDRTALQHGGRSVKWLGDGVMLHFPDPGPGVLAALVMLDGITDAGLPPAHVGLHAGPVVFTEGDYFGQTVNIASRIGEYARPGEVLVSQAVVDACGEPDGLTFVEIGPVELKGVGEALDLYQAERQA
jgi:adenylate cyclase